jgi:iron complex transport system ATP-binding protein
VTHPVVELHIERHYRVEVARPILEDVRFRIERGEHWAMVGPNGCGKSTLLAIISGDLWPSLGVVRVLGAEYGRVDKREHRKRIGLVSAALFMNLPPGDLAVEVAASGIHAMIGKLGAPDATELERGHRALARVSAGSWAMKPYGVLSQGERQRVMIARALVNEPELLILDESCGGLDPVSREAFLEDLGRLAEEARGPTQIHVTHHLEEIPHFVTHSLVLREGRIVAAGPVAQTLTSACLTAAFGAECHVKTEGTGRDRRFALAVIPGTANRA